MSSSDITARRMSCQEAATFRLDSRWVGGLPLVNAVVRQLAIEPLLQQAVPVRDPRVRMPPAQVLGVLLRNLILNQRQPLYTQGEWAARADPALLGLPAGSARRLSDDQMGRALDQLFRADRASLLTRTWSGRSGRSRSSWTSCTTTRPRSPSPATTPPRPVRRPAAAPRCASPTAITRTIGPIS